MKRLFSILCLAALMAFSCNNGGDEPSGNTTPGAPENLVLHSATTTSLTFQWKLVTGADSYKWRLVKGNEEIQSGVVKSRNVVVEGLEQETAYRFGVRSVGADGTLSKETVIDATTEKETQPEEPPVNPEDPPVNPDPTITYADFLIPEVEEADGLARAFPGAEGGGMWTTGGRGGSVYHVTSLEDTNTQGTLRYGVETLSGPRIIVFDVAGIIELRSQLQVKKGDVYIAGQTAPGDGICLKNYTFRISASNVIVRFIRCRMGDEKKTADDAIQIMDHDGDKFTNIIIDHCSVSWCTDECASFYGQKDFSFQWNIVSESLRNSIHDKGSHGYGGIWGGTNSSYHHNLLAHHDSRNPRLDHDYVSSQKGPLHIFNNVVYNWSGNTCYGGESSSNNGSDYRKYNFFNNYYKPGPATPSSHIWFLEPTTSCSNCGGTILPGHFYMAGNVMYGKSWTSNNWSTSSVHANQSVIDKIKVSEPYHTDEYQSVHSGEGCLEPVLKYAGASFVRDAIDTRIADETRRGTSTYTGSNGSTGGLIDTQGDVGGWPEYGYTETVRDADMDGMPDWFEEQCGLNKSSAADASAKTIDTKGRYTNLEMYLHYIVRNIIAAQNADANYTKL
ncbi:MAG: fibronectin type III domain-containing protein [Bacteroidales bacterium]|nr:fibronectin type III domain-containing protein [Bacteroidales bacterium]